MPRAEAGSAKAIGNAIKAKGLGRLKWYCQVCQKQCRDENGFKMHTQAESHLRQMLVVGEQAHKHIDNFSKDFMDEFVTHLSRRHGTQRVRANAVYNEYIQDKHHIHMNSTKWVTLSEFIKYLGREGIVRVDENEKGFWITWVDTSPKALARQAEMQKRERADVDEEQRQRRQLKEQIERARLQAEALKGEGQGDLEKGLQRGEGEKVSLTLGGLRGVAGGSPDASTAETTNPSTSTSTEPTTVTPSTTTIITTPSTDPTPKLTSNPLKRASTSNVFKLSKSLKSSKSSTPSETETEKTHLSSKKFLTVAERVMLEDQERQKRKLSSGYQGMGPSRGGR